MTGRYTLTAVAMIAFGIIVLSVGIASMASGNIYGLGGIVFGTLQIVVWVFDA